MGDKKSKKCFIMMPISDTEGYDKGHFTRVYEHLIKPAVMDAGFEPIRADDTSKANFIVVDILKQILDCDMAICDLSSRNPNVFYELGIRQSFNLKTVLIKDNKTAMPFDIAGIRTLPYNESLRIDEVKKDIPNMAKCIKETSEADVKEVNSLLQLLSIEKPALLPDKITLSQDSSVILQALNNISQRLENISPKDITDCLIVPNGSRFSRGEEISVNGKVIGNLVDYGLEYAIVRTIEGKKILFAIKDAYNWYDDLPF